MSRYMKCEIEKMVSGGEIGADRAALDWAIAHGVPRGGCLQ
ncbi:MAG: YpsA SLOG family protein [Limisphaerales bacterium]